MKIYREIAEISAFFCHKIFTSKGAAAMKSFFTSGLADELTKDVSQGSDVVFLPSGTSMDDLRPTLALARRVAKT